jgi:hypothetical protein
MKTKNSIQNSTAVIFPQEDQHFTPFLLRVGTILPLSLGGEGQGEGV